MSGAPATPPQLSRQSVSLEGLTRAQRFSTQLASAQAAAGDEPDLSGTGFYRTSAKAAIGRPTLRVHDLRHSAASIWLASGADPTVVQRVLGHASATMTLDAPAVMPPLPVFIESPVVVPVISPK